MWVAAEKVAILLKTMMATVLIAPINCMMSPIFGLFMS